MSYSFGSFAGPWFAEIPEAAVPGQAPPRPTGTESPRITLQVRDPQTLTALDPIEVGAHGYWEATYEVAVIEILSDAGTSSPKWVPVFSVEAQYQMWAAAQLVDDLRSRVTLIEENGGTGGGGGSGTGVSVYSWDPVSGGYEPAPDYVIVEGPAAPDPATLIPGLADRKVLWVRTSD